MKTKLGHPPWKAHSYFQVISREWLGRWREGEDMLEKAAETTATIGEYTFHVFPSAFWFAFVSTVFCILYYATIGEYSSHVFLSAFCFVFVSTIFMYFVCFLVHIYVLKQ